PDTYAEARPLDAGGWELTFILPRGAVNYSLDELPQTEIDRWGGRDKIMRPLVVVLDRDLGVLTMTHPTLAGGTRVVEYTRAACSLDGFQVSEARAGSPSIRLVSCEYDPGADESAFEIEAVEARFVGRRLAERQRTPLSTEAPKGDVAPIRSSNRPAVGIGATSLMLAGLVVLLVGGVALWLRGRGAK
ncbi:MAG: hypothetical protein L0271_04795, partial [Gemmatimonadetes bacterium]|nr:hypothetical protein [Gemmatimonadota bacterium]